MENITLLPFQLQGLENSFTILTPYGVKTFQYDTKENMERNKSKLIKLLNENK